MELDPIVVFIQSRVELHTPGDPILFYNSLIEYRNLPLGRGKHRVIAFHSFVPQRFECRGKKEKEEKKKKSAAPEKKGVKS